MKEFFGKHKKRLIILLVIIVIVIIFAVLNGQAAGKRKEAMENTPKQDTAQIERRTLVESISATGKVTSVESKSVKADVTGVKVESLNVKVGDRVEAGDVLCILDAESIEEDLKDAQTTLNAASGKTQIDVSSAERSLSEAQTTRSIEAERASQDAADAWNDYLKALTDLEEAESDYQTAKETASETNSEYEYRQERLAEAKNKMEAAAAGTGNSSRYETEFAGTKEAMKNYVDSLNDSSKSGALDVESNIYLAADLTNLTGTAIAPSATNDEQGELDSYLGTLTGLQEAYRQSNSADAAYQQAKAEYEALSAEATSWQNKYQTAKNSEASYETAYENAITAADNKLDTYNQKVRNQEDTARTNDSAVNNKEDSLATSKLNASTSGLTDKQQIKQYKEQIDACTVTAPVSGVITELNVEVGDTYQGTAIATIEDISDYEISAEIEEYDISSIREGQKVVIKTNGTGDTELEGVVKEIAPRATTGSASVTYTVTISILTPCEDLKMDMTAKLSIILESKENVLTVPYDAVQEDEEGNNFIEVMNEASEDGNTGESTGKNAGNGEAAMEERPAKRISVTKGIESDYYVEVTGAELKEGMTVVVPSSGEEGMDMQRLMTDRGPMGGF